MNHFLIISGLILMITAASGDHFRWEQLIVSGVIFIGGIVLSFKK